jgi:hypothetical protein
MTLSISHLRFVHVKCLKGWVSFVTGILEITTWVWCWAPVSTEALRKALRAHSGTLSMHVCRPCFGLSLWKSALSFTIFWSFLKLKPSQYHFKISIDHLYEPVIMKLSFEILIEYGVNMLIMVSGLPRDGWKAELLVRHLWHWVDCGWWCYGEISLLHFCKHSCYLVLFQ